MWPRIHFSMNGGSKKGFFCLGIAIIIISLFSLIFYYFFLRSSPGRTNILVLGTAGKGYIGGDLTDTIIFFSLDHQTGKTLVLSLPRDIWIPALRTKLNAVYYYQGMEGTKKAVEEILNQPVDYGILINFDVFTKIVDALDGVEVEVERAFDDYKYPIAGRENDPCDGDPQFKCRYEHVHFEAGLQHMDGERALKYVRSRFAEGEEGTDFARSKRQQRLLTAIKNKILSPQFFLNPRKVLQLIKVAISSIETDIPQRKYLDFFKLALKFKSKNLRLKVLNEDYLITPPPSKKRYDEQWVLIPRNGNWKEVQKYIGELLQE